MVGFFFCARIKSIITILENIKADQCLETTMAEIFQRNDWKIQTYLFQSDIVFSKMCRFSMDGSITTALTGIWKLKSFGCNSEITSVQAL